MNRQSIHQQIDLLLNALNEQHEQIRQSKGTIPQMELDLMLQNSQQIFEALLMLNHHNALTSLDEVKAAVTQRILAEKRSFERKTEEVKTEKNVEPVVKETKSEPAQHATAEEVMVKAAAAVPAEDKKEKTAKPKKLSGGVNATLFEGTHSLANHFEDEESLHDHIASSKAGGETVGENLHRKPIRDLKAAIGINEKFLFINQLFDGNLQDYSEAIEKLNGAPNLDVAKQLITTDLTMRFNWKESDQHVRSFTDLVERRFIA